ncbi:MAG: hypothetical protein VKP72_00320 [bacterium]|nr:hypothetical protein [bacterium]
MKGVGSLVTGYRTFGATLFAAHVLGACYWAAGSSPSNLLTLRNQALARNSGLPALEVSVDVSDGFTVDGGTVRVLDRSLVESVQLEVLVQDASQSWLATRSLQVAQDELRQVRNIQNLDADVPLRLRAKLLGKTQVDSSTIIGDPEGHTLDLPALSYSKRLTVEWTIPLPGGDLASPTIAIN